MSDEKMIKVLCKWPSVWGGDFKAPSGRSYACEKETGESMVSESDAHELCSTSGWRMKPEEVPAPVLPPAPKVEAPIEPPKPQGRGRRGPPMPEAPKPSEPAPEASSEAQDESK